MIKRHLFSIVRNNILGDDQFLQKLNFQFPEVSFALTKIEM